VVLLTPHIWSPEQAMAHAPPPHGAVGPPSAATSFELATGPPTPESSATAPGSAAVPPDAPPPGAASMIAPSGRAVAPAPTPGQPTPAMPAASGVASAPTPAPAPAGPPAVGDQPVSSPSRRRPWPSLRQLWSRRAPASSPDPSSGQDGPA